MATLVSVMAKGPKSRHYNQDEPLEHCAARLFPGHEYNQAAWIRAVAFLRRKATSRWVLDGQFKPKWTAT